MVKAGLTLVRPRSDRASATVQNGGAHDENEVCVVRFENVGLRYGMGAEVLRDISFEIGPQSFQFLTGPSGAGKTTLLRLILLSLRPTRGLISLFGRDASTLDKDSITEMRR